MIGLPIRTLTWCVSASCSAFRLKIYMKLNGAVDVEVGGNCGKREPAQTAGKMIGFRAAGTFFCEHILPAVSTFATARQRLGLDRRSGSRIAEATG